MSGFPDTGKNTSPYPFMKNWKKNRKKSNNRENRKKIGSNRSKVCVKPFKYLIAITLPTGVIIVDSFGVTKSLQYRTALYNGFFHFHTIRIDCDAGVGEAGVFAHRRYISQYVFGALCFSSSTFSAMINKETLAVRSTRKITLPHRQVRKTSMQKNYQLKLL